VTLIAILDDRASNRHIYARLAGTITDGVTVPTFGDPVEALEWASGTVPDLVITDYKMPTLDGAQFTRRFRETAGCTDVPVLVITAYDDRAFRLAALEAGATDFLRSPVDHAEFVTRARNMLRMYNQHRMLQNRAQKLESDLQDSERSRERVLRDSRESLVQVIDTVPAFISATDRSGRYVFVNAMHALLAGASPTALVGQSMAQVFGPAYESRSRSLDQLVFRTGNALPAFEEEVVDQTGARRILLTTKSPLSSAQFAVSCVLTTSLDITDRKRAEQHLLHMANHDSLTGLPNRALLRSRLERRISTGMRADASLALHFIDLDHFKAANDRLGHQLGDQLLREVGAGSPRRSVPTISSHAWAATNSRFCRTGRARRIRRKCSRNRSWARSARRSCAAARKCGSAAASASRFTRRTVPRSRSCCATPTSPCTRPRLRAVPASGCLFRT